MPQESKLIVNVSGTNRRALPTTSLHPFSPYSPSTSFDVNPPQVLVVFHQDKAGHFAELPAQLQGIAQYAYFAHGMGHRYGLTTLTYRITEITEYPAWQCLAAIDRLLRAETGTFAMALIKTCCACRE